MKYNSKIWFVLPMRCFLFVTAFSLCRLMTQKPFTEIANWWSILASALNIATILILWLICKRNHITYCELIQYKKTRKSLSKGFLFIILMLMIGIGGMYLAGWLCYGEFPYLASMLISPIPPYLAILNFFVLPITTTVAEDGIYLGYGVNAFSSKWSAILFPAFFYALQHSFIPTLPDMQFIAYRFLSFFPLTIWICYQYYRNKNILYIMTGHWILNIATAMQIIMTSL